jgi:hypothetical protein
VSTPSRFGTTRAVLSRLRRHFGRVVGAAPGQARQLPVSSDLLSQRVAELRLGVVARQWFGEFGQRAIARDLVVLDLSP